MAEFNSGCFLVFLQECLETGSLSCLASSIKVNYHMMWVIWVSGKIYNAGDTVDLREKDS